MVVRPTLDVGTVTDKNVVAPTPADDIAPPAKNRAACTVAGRQQGQVHRHPGKIRQGQLRTIHGGDAEEAIALAGEVEIGDLPHQQAMAADFDRDLPILDRVGADLVRCQSTVAVPTPPNDDVVAGPADQNVRPAPLRMLGPNVVGLGSAIRANHHRVVAYDGIWHHLPAAVDNIVAGAADQNIAASTGGGTEPIGHVDSIVAAPLRKEGFDPHDRLGRIAGNVGIGPHHHVVALIAIEDVASVGGVRSGEIMHGTPDDDVVARSAADHILPAHRGIGGPDVIGAVWTNRPAVGRQGDGGVKVEGLGFSDIEDGHSIVAKENIDPGPAGDLVVTGAAKDVVAAAASDRNGVVAPVDVVRPRLHDQHPQGGIAVDSAVVPDHVVVAGASGDGVAATAAQNDIAAIAALNGVVPVVIGVGGDDVVEVGHPAPSKAAADRAVITKDEVIAIPGRDGVVTFTPQNDIVAGCGRDGVVAPESGGALEAAGLIAEFAGDDSGDDTVVETDVALVADDDIVATPGMKGVAAEATDDYVGPGAPLNDVVATEMRVEGRGQKKLAWIGQTGGGRFNPGMVTHQDIGAAENSDLVDSDAPDDDVPAISGLEDIVSAARGVDALIRTRSHIGAIAKEDVIALSTMDGVAAEAADNDRVASAADGRVVAGIHVVDQTSGPSGNQGRVALNGAVVEKDDVEAGAAFEPVVA